MQPRLWPLTEELDFAVECRGKEVDAGRPAAVSAADATAELLSSRGSFRLKQKGPL